MPMSHSGSPAIVRRRSTDIVVDFHTHIFDHEVCQFVKNIRPPNATEPQLVDGYLVNSAAHRRRHPRDTSDELQARLQDMDEFGIDVQVIFNHVAQYCYWADAETGERLARLQNNRLAEFVARQPDRFVGMGTVPLQDIAAAVRELRRMVSELGFKAVALSSHAEGVELGDERLWPFWSAVQELGIAAFIHPSGHNDPRFEKHLMWNGVGQPIEEAIAMSSLIYEGTLDRYPNLKIGIAHGGGFLPYYAGRVDRNFRARPDATPNIHATPSEYMPRFFYDTVVYNVDQLEFLVHKVGAERIVMGGDYPVGQDDIVGFVKGANIGQGEKRMILGENAARLLGFG
jgi:aminocarboxymuconate-semialdehyde decarboxylase